MSNTDVTRRPIVFTNGCFDIIHAGHIAVLERCAELADIYSMFGGTVVVGVNSDESVKRLKGRMRPVTPLKQRVEVLRAIRYVDHVIVFEEDTPYELIKKLQPDYIVKGGDYKKEDVVGADIARVEIVPTVGKLSSTSIIQRLLQNA